MYGSKMHDNILLAYVPGDRHISLISEKDNYGTNDRQGCCMNIGCICTS